MLDGKITGEEPGLAQAGSALARAAGSA
jgi:hypothetical protein